MIAINTEAAFYTVQQRSLSNDNRRSLVEAMSGVLSPFTALRSYASAVLGVVILSVCPTHACFVTKPNNVLWIF